jgi:hypothetical protein
VPAGTGTDRYAPENGGFIFSLPAKNAAKKWIDKKEDASDEKIIFSIFNEIQGSRNNERNRALCERRIQRPRFSEAFQ